MIEAKNSMLINTSEDFAVGMLSGLTARFIGWPIERIWYLRQANPSLNYRTLFLQTFSKKSFGLILKTYQQAGLIQSAANAIAYMGVVNSIIRYNQQYCPEKSTWRVGIEAGLSSAFTETMATAIQERKKAMLFSGMNYTQISLLSWPSLRCLCATLVKNMVVNSSTVMLFLASHQYIQKITDGTPLAPASSFFAGCFAAGPTQLIGMPFVNFQNRVLRESTTKVSKHISTMLSLKLQEVYSGILARWTHQMLLGGTSFTLLSLFNKQHIRASLIIKDQDKNKNSASKI